MDGLTVLLVLVHQLAGHGGPHRGVDRPGLRAGDVWDVCAVEEDDRHKGLVVRHRSLEQVLKLVDEKGLQSLAPYPQVSGHLVVLDFFSNGFHEVVADGFGGGVGYLCITIPLASTGTWNFPQQAILLHR